MADVVVSFVLEELSNFVKEEGSSLTGIERDFKDIKDELESIQVVLKDADTKVADDGVKTWVKQLREASFRIEDVIDKYEYSKYVAQRVNHSGFIASLKAIPALIKTKSTQYQIVSEIKDIKLSLAGIRERSTRFEFQSGSGSESYRGTKAPRIGDP